MHDRHVVFLRSLDRRNLEEYEYGDHQKDNNSEGQLIWVRHNRASILGFDERQLMQGCPVKDARPNEIN
jgi:hypothetical protein